MKSLTDGTIVSRPLLEALDDRSLPDLDVHDVFTGPEVTLDGEDIEKFRSIVGNNDESFKSVRTDKIGGSYGLCHCCWLAGMYTLYLKLPF